MNDLADRGIFALLDPALTAPPERGRSLLSALLLALAWLYVVAFIGPYVGSTMATALLDVVPRTLLLAGTAGAMAMVAALAWRRNPRLAVLGLVLLAYVAGTTLSSVGYTLIARLEVTGWLRFALQRGAYGALVAAPLGLVLFLARPVVGRTAGLVGRGWSGRTRLFSRVGEINTWAAWLGGLALMAGVPFFLLMQFASGFALVEQPWWFVGAVLVMSLVNATAEEVIFRWGIQPAVVASVGVGRGLWFQGLFFGLHHVGLSVSLLATLPGALLVGVGSIAFGKSVLETRGLAWAIAAHMVFDIGIFAAFLHRF